VLTMAGDLMVAIWWGTQADEAFPDAWHSDAGGQVQFRSKVYLSPKLWYLRVNVIEAQDLLASDRLMAEPVRHFAFTAYLSAVSKFFPCIHFEVQEPGRFL
jgi:hypothetical protein